MAKSKMRDGEFLQGSSSYLVDGRESEIEGVQKSIRECLFQLRGTKLSQFLNRKHQNFESLSINYESGKVRNNKSD
jgi:hypothetical protein